MHKLLANQSIIGNYIKTALRSIANYKQHFLINVLGLGVGFAAAILIGLFAWYELSYDQFQPNAQRVYRLSQHFVATNTQAPISNYRALFEASQNQPVEAVFSLSYSNNFDVVVDGEHVKLDGVRSATPNIQEFIDVQVISGDLQRVLTTPNSVALTESASETVFGIKNTVGKTVFVKDKTWTVGAVIRDLPENTHFSFSGLTAMPQKKMSYGTNNSYNYLRVDKGVDPDSVFNTLREKYYQLTIPDDVNNIDIEYDFQPLADIHLKSNRAYEMKKNGSQSSVYTAIALSFLLVFLAAFNFINMSIAQSSKRAKEVGIRKAVGASKFQVAVQFLTEYVLLSFFSLVIACALVELILPIFNQWVDRSLALNYLSLQGVMLLVFSTVIGLLAGIYPALFMASFNTKRVLSGELTNSRLAISIRKGLLVLQSALSIGLIVGSLILHEQIEHLYHLPVGYEKEGRLMVEGIPSQHLFYTKNDALTRRLAEVPGVNHVGFSDIKLTGSLNTRMTITTDNNQLQNEGISFIGVGYDLVKNLGVSLVAGRDFSSEFASDWYAYRGEQGTGSIIITESMVKKAGYESPEAAIGHTFYGENSHPDYPKIKESVPVTYTIVGVISDVQVGSVDNSSSFIAFTCGMSWAWFSNLIINTDLLEYSELKSDIEAVLIETIGFYNPKISVLSEEYTAIYQDDQRTSDLVAIFSGLAMFLACIGVFGLASFSALRRQKEIAVRKVLGASRVSLVNLLAKEYVGLVGISILLAFPITYGFAGAWLENFNDRIAQPLWAYGFAVALMMGITWVTVASLGFRAASIRPALTLRRD